MKCPDCGTTLATEEYSGVQLEGCGTCGGVWLDPGELKVLVQDRGSLAEVDSDNVPSAEPVESEKPDRRCPRCDAGLESFRYAYDSPVVLDSCVTCSGIWAQDGELAKIESHLAEPISDREKAALTVAHYTLAHQNEMIRQRRLTAFFNLMRRRPPRWSLFS